MVRDLAADGAKPSIFPLIFEMGHVGGIEESEWRTNGVTNLVALYEGEARPD